MWFLGPNIEKLKVKRDVPGLVMALGNTDPRIRSAATKALGEIGDVNAVEPLRKALLDESNSVCLAAINALGEIGDARAVKTLEALLNNLLKRGGKYLKPRDVKSAIRLFEILELHPGFKIEMIEAARNALEIIEEKNQTQ